MDRYFRSICDSLLAGCVCVGAGASVSPCQISIEVGSGGLSLPIDKATPCGLIVNELVANAMKHAFVCRERGRVGVSLRREERKPGEVLSLLLVVEDDGVGLGSAPREPRLGGMGSLLVEALSGQLGGRLEKESGSWGSRLSLRFAAPSRD